MEDVVAELYGYAMTVVRDGNSHAAARARRRGDSEPPLLAETVAHGVDGVARQVQQHLLELHRVRTHPRKARGFFYFDRDAFRVRIELDERQHVVDDAIDIEGLRIEILLANELAQ